MPNVFNIQLLNTKSVRKIQSCQSYEDFVNI